MSVFPAHSTDENGRCSCGDSACSSPGKHPRITDNLAQASRDPKQIRAWWTRWPDANIAIAAGESGLIVGDVDTDEGRPGPDNWRALEVELGDALGQTTIVETPSGGFHLWWLAGEHHVASGNDLLGPGLDVKTHGGYVLAPGSEIAGRSYRFREGHGIDRLSSLPQALAARLEQVREPKAASSFEPFIAVGQRNSTLASIAGTMRRRGMDKEAIFAALLVTNAQQCRPPLDEGEVRKIAVSVARYDPADVSAQWVAAIERPLPIISVRELAGLEPEVAPAILVGYIYENALTDLTAHPKKGKTTLLVSIADAVSRGEPFLDLDTRRGPVVYLTEESPTTFLSAVRRVGGEDAEDVYVIFRRDAFGMNWPEVCAEVRAHCERLGAVLVVVDTLSDWAGIRGDDENSAGAALLAIHPLREMMQLPHLAVVVARHERKSGGEVGQSARGSSQFTGAVDVVVSLRSVSGSRSQRRLLALSRFDETPEELVIELIGGRFHSLGPAQGLHRSEQERRILAVLPVDREQALAVRDVAASVAGMSDATVRRVLDRLVAAGDARAESGVVPGKQRTAVGYWRAPQGEDA